MNEALVNVTGVSKVYRLWSKPSARLTSMMLGQVRDLPLLPGAIRRRVGAAVERRGKEFHAVHEVNFSLNRGESMGIIGRNGSGKSTLLQIIAGTLQPTTGTVEVNGRVAALLELGSGFNPEFTGRENVLLQTALFGFSRKEMLTRMKEVEDFAGIGAFIDQPTKVYSSGMLIRLAFATQTILSPELLIVDEALAVGDVFFQAKCAQLFEERVKAGMALILVSHDLLSIKALCRQALVMHEGRVSFIGPSADAVNHYHQLHRGAVVTEVAASRLLAPAESGRHLPAGAKERHWEVSQEVGSREAEFVFCRILNQRGMDASAVELGEELHIELYLRSKTKLENLLLGIEFANRHNQVIYGVTSVHLGQAFFKAEAGVLQGYRFSLRANFGHGSYLVDVALGWGDRGDGAPEQLLHRVARIAAFTVRHPGVRPAFFGGADLGAKLAPIWS